ncbi:MAG: hypothetical protein ACREEA_00860 [Stellaceae bacterium]
MAIDSTVVGHRGIMVQAREIVEARALDPETVVPLSIFVDRVVVVR